MHLLHTLGVSFNASCFKHEANAIVVTSSLKSSYDSTLIKLSFLVRFLLASSLDVPASLSWSCSSSLSSRSCTLTFLSSCSFSNSAMSSSSVGLYKRIQRVMSAQSIQRLLLIHGIANSNSSAVPMLLRKVSVLKIPLDEGLAAVLLKLISFVWNSTSYNPSWWKMSNVDWLHYHSPLYGFPDYWCKHGMVYDMGHIGQQT